MIEWLRNPALEEELYARLRLKYLHDRTQEIHFSDTLYCLTKAFYNKVNPIPPDNATLGLFAIGFALEEVLIKAPPSVDQIHQAMLYGGLSTMAARVHDLITKPVVEPYQYEGLWFSPDYQLTSMVGEMDLKSTRMWEEKDGDGRPKINAERPYGFPNSWLKQFMGYAHRLGPQPADDITPVDYVDYSVGIVYIAAAKLIAGTIRFAWDDVELNMATHLHRAAILEDHLDKGTPPVPFMYNEQWECKNCPYLDRCQA